MTFDSVEEFWGVYVGSAVQLYLKKALTVFLKNNITPTSELALKSDYHLFKRGVRPEWEVG